MNKDGAVLLKQPAKLGPGSVCVICMESSRSQEFWFSLVNLATSIPPGLAQLRSFQGSDVAALRNNAVAAFLDQDVQGFGGGWLWFIDDDHAFQADILSRLARHDVDIVQPLCLRRASPFYPVATGLDGNFLSLKDVGETSLVEVMFAGSSGMLIKRRVLEAVEPPWFELGNGVSEDVAFCRKAAAAGFKIHVDAGTPLGHATSTVIWPKWDPDRGEWMTGFTIANGAEVAIETVEPPPLPETR